MRSHLARRIPMVVAVALALAVLGGTSPSPAYAATFTVNSNNDVDDGTCNLAHCSLREAINASNASTGVKDTINFSIGTGKKTITPGSPLPTIIDPVIIDGATQSCSPDSTPCIELDGTSAGSNADGLEITAGNSTVRGLVINGFSRYGISLKTAGSNVIEGNYIGTDVTAAIALGNLGGGVQIWGGSGNTIGGTAAGARNVISANHSFGVHILDATGNQVLGNYIGTNASGSAALGNVGPGLSLSNGAVGNTIGGTAAGAGNVISGSQGYQGVSIGNGASGNQVQGNYIGTDASGSAPLGNGTSGLEIFGHENTIGGTAAGAGNTIAYNQLVGVWVATAVEPATGNAIRGNSIHSNGSGGIGLGVGGNGQLAAPIIDSAGGSVSGHTSPKCYPCTVEVFSDSDGQGRIFHGSTATNNDATGTWTYTGAVTGPKITATVTDASDNTSEFSAPYRLPAVGGIAELPEIGGASPEEGRAPSKDPGWSAGGYALLAGGLAAAAMVAAGAWYTRRRWLR
jgi:CSLREA domain-containing protein